MTKRKVSITKVFTFDCAHHLNDYEGKCKNIHGHTYKLEITVKGITDKNGLVMDFHDLDDLVNQKVLVHVDHKYLNECLEFNPTCENIGLWIWEQIIEDIHNAGCSLERIVLWETPTSFITIDKEDME
ncbi:MAG: 6-carboxytetrahydropterin synthase QueD [Clostridia bacterium]|nr:6-carboxytetrahydropterin synthase QueD [Clostridia bacterium]